MLQKKIATRHLKGHYIWLGVLGRGPIRKYASLLRITIVHYCSLKKSENVALLCPNNGYYHQSTPVVKNT